MYTRDQGGGQVGDSDERDNGVPGATVVSAASGVKVSGRVYREDLHLAVVIERDDGEFLRVRAFHAWRSDRHAGNRDARDIRPLCEQPLYVLGGDVPLDDVSVDQRRVAGGQSPRDVVLGLDRPDVRHVGRPDCETAVLEM